MKVLFVCTGNTCRSCMAEAIFNNTCHVEDIKAISAGVHIVNNSKTSDNAAFLINKYYNENWKDRSAVQITEEMVKNADLVLTMTHRIKEFLSGLFPDCKEKIFTLSEYAGVREEISDPYGGDISVYSKTFRQLEDIINKLVIKLKEDKGI